MVTPYFAFTCAAGKLSNVHIPPSAKAGAEALRRSAERRNFLCMDLSFPKRAHYVSREPVGPTGTHGLEWWRRNKPFGTASGEQLAAYLRVPAFVSWCGNHRDPLYERRWESSAITLG